MAKCTITYGTFPGHMVYEKKTAQPKYKCQLCAVNPGCNCEACFFDNSKCGAKHVEQTHFFR